MLASDILPRVPLETIVEQYYRYDQGYEALVILIDDLDHLRAVARVQMVAHLTTFRVSCLSDSTDGYV